MGQDNLNKALASRTRKVIAYQLLIGFLIALGFWWAQGPWQAQSALYGVFVNMCMAFLLGRGVARAGQIAAYSARRGMVILVISVVQRFLLVLVLFGVGFAVLKLDPLAAIVGFGLSHLAYLISARESVNI
ncbi:MAG: ATP synthase subunit I [Gammaproteobacteria bacterium]